jgi:hypothetical protein
MLKYVMVELFVACVIQGWLQKFDRAKSLGIRKCAVFLMNVMFLST